MNKCNEIWDKYGYMYEDTYFHVDYVLGFIEGIYGKSNVKFKTINFQSFKSATKYNNRDKIDSQTEITIGNQKYYIGFGDEVILLDSNGKVIYHAKKADNNKPDIDLLKATFKK